LAALSPVPPLAPELASGVLVFSVELPPELVVLSLPVPPDELELEGSSLEVFAEPVEGLEPLLEVVATVDVEVVGVASLSACVLAGGVISGVLCGGTSAELLLPPHAASVRPTSSAAAPARIGASDRSRETPPFGGNPRFDQRGVTSPTGPSGVRRWGSRSDPSAPAARTRDRSAGSQPRREAWRWMAQAEAPCPRPPAARPTPDRGRSRQVAPPG